MYGKKFLFLAGVMAVILAAGTVWAIGDSAYNRPNPLMDYVPQETAIFDTRYDNLAENDCRECHGDSLADRHHYNNIVLIWNRCTDCHEIIPDPPGVVVIRDCTTSGCHSWDDVGERDDSGVPPNGWHHATDLSGSENCVACHDRNIVAEITPFSSFQEYVPSVVTPTPFSCENCHWDQGVLADQGGAFDPTDVNTANLAGHPSTFDHVDKWGNFVGYFEYQKPILGNMDTHHMGIKGNVAAACYKCHSNDPNDPSWDPYEPELIRYCEICHDVSTLHTIFAHVGPPGTGGGPAAEGWEATGFHVIGALSNTPTVYRGNNADVPPFSPLAAKHFEANEQCFGCHGDNVPTITIITSSAPVLTGIEPTAGCPGAQVTLTGSFFDFGQIPGREVQIKATGSSLWDTAAVDVPVISWNDDRIVFELPAWTFAPGNFMVRVYDDNRTPGQKPSNQLGFTVKDCNSPTVITPDSGPCSNNWIELTGPTGVGFGGAKDLISGVGATDGVYRVVQLSASQGDYIAIKDSWSNPKAKFKFKNFFEDLDGDYLQDIASEPTLTWCNGLALGTYNVFLKYVIYEDTDGSATIIGGGPGYKGYSNNDLVYQVEASNPLVFELTNEPYIKTLNPSALSKGPNRLRIIGQNFGPTQLPGDEVRLGKIGHYLDPLNKGFVLSKVRMWSNTKIIVKFSPGVPNFWVGKRRHVWVIKDGVASNRRPVDIL